MGLILGSENKEWWSRLNDLYPKFMGISLNDYLADEKKGIEDVGDLASAEAINLFLVNLKELQKYDYSKDINWSEFNKEKLKNPGDLLQLITTERIKNALIQLENTCVYNSLSSGNGHRSKHSDSSSDSDSCSDYSDRSNLTNSPHNTEGPGLANAASRSNAHTNTCPANISHTETVG